MRGTAARRVTLPVVRWRAPVAFTVTFPTNGPLPDPAAIADWLTEQGEPFDEEAPHTLTLRALPVTLVMSPDLTSMQA